MSSCCVCCSSAPGWAAHLRLEALDERTLRLSWSAPAGDWDFYRVLLFNGSSVLMNRTVDRSLVEFNFTDGTLIPGRLYRAAVSVESGYLSSTADCHERLGVLLVSSASQTSSLLLWKRRPLNCIVCALLVYFKSYLKKNFTCRYITLIMKDH